MDLSADRLSPDETTPISFADPVVQRCPFPAYDRLRAEAPVYLDPITGHYVLTRYADVRKVLINHRLFSSDAALVGRRQTSVTEQVNQLYAEKGWRRANSFQLMDEPEHKAKRSLVDKAFSHWNVQALTPYIEHIVNSLIDGFIDNGQCEFVSDFAVKLTMQVIANQLGVEGSNPATFERDVAKLRFWSDCAVEIISPMITPERELELTEHAIDFQHFCAGNIARVTANPDETLLSKLVATVHDGDGKPDIAELLGFIRALLVAGNETTRFALSAGVKLLIDQPALAAQIRADPERIDMFVEEVLRLMAPVQTLFRRAREDVTIDGVDIPAGSRIEVRYGAANRDPATFEQPDAVDLCRRGSAHLAFGLGIHGCIGMQLARAELRIAFRILLDRLDNFRAANDERSYDYTSIYISYGLTRLDLSFGKFAMPDPC